MGERSRLCWICRRRLPETEMTFTQVEDDGCGEWECRDRKSCILAAEEMET